MSNPKHNLYVFYNPPYSEFTSNATGYRANINLADYEDYLPWVKEIAELEEHPDFARIYSGPLYETLRGLVMLQAEQESDYFRMRMTAEELDSLYRLVDTKEGG